MVQRDINSVEQQPTPLCIFTQPAANGLQVTISAFPFASGQYKGYTLDSIRKIKPPAGITVKTNDYPEWGVGSFCVVQSSSGPTVAESWSPHYASTIINLSVKGQESAYLSHATHLGQALFAVSR